MLNKNILLLLLCSAFVGVSLQAEPAKKQKTVKQETTTKAQENPDKEVPTKNEADETENDEEETTKPKLTAAERSKCTRLKTALVGERFDGPRIAAFLIAFYVGYRIEKKAVTSYIDYKLKKAIEGFNYQGDAGREINQIGNIIVGQIERYGDIRWPEANAALANNELWQIPPRLNQQLNEPNFLMNKLISAGLIVAGTAAAATVTSIAIHLGLLKKQKVSAITTWLTCLNPAGLAIYSLLNRFVLSSNLTKLLANYDSEDIPTCVKSKFEKLAEEYVETNTLSINPYQRSTFVIEILAELDKALSRK